MASGILLDIDGTLVDSTSLMVRALREALRQASVKVPSAGVLRERIRLNSPRAILRSLGVFSIEPYWESFIRNIDLCEPYLQSWEAVIASARSRGKRIGIVTSLPRVGAEALLLHLNLTQHVSIVITYGTTTRHKPHPEPVLAGVRGLGSEPPDCVYIGDSTEDVMAGRAAGTLTGAALWGFGNPDALRELGPDIVLERPQELASYLSRGGLLGSEAP